MIPESALPEFTADHDFRDESPTREYPPEAWSLEKLQLMARLEARRLRTPTPRTQGAPQ